MPTMSVPPLVLLNPFAAGGRAARLAEKLREACSAHGARLEVTPSVQAARDRLMHEPEATRVVLVGGDGTLHQMLPALLARAHGVGLVPLGTGNDTARALGLHHLSWHAALTLALDGTLRNVDVGEATFEAAGACGDSELIRVPFISSFSSGFDAAVSARARTAPGWLAGMARYLWATLREVAALQLSHMKVSADGRAVHDGPALFVSALNTASYGSGMPVVPHARMDDGQLHLLLAGAFTRAGTLLMLPRLLNGSHLTDPRVQCLAFQTLQIDAKARIPLAADGEVLPSASTITIRVRRATLPMVCPT
jgi:diacylglycerol kinase (ATP)